MKQDILRLAAVICLGLLIGLVTGQVAICLIAALIIFIIWQYCVLANLLKWLQRRKEHDPPELPGVIDEVCREIDYLRERHKQRKIKLSKFLKRFRESTSAMPDAVVILGEHAEIQWANNKSEEYLGIHWPQDVGQRITNLIRYPDLVAYVANEKNYQSGKTLQIDSPEQAGMKLEIRVSLFGKKRKLMVARDITAIYQINQVRRDFIANASHELRSPLTVISGYLEGFEDDPEECPETWRPRILQMRKQAERMQRLLEDLLRLSSLESTPRREQLDIVPVPELLTGIYQEAQALSGEMEHVFYLECDPDLWLRADQRELYSAFSNLIFNAVQYTPKRGVIRIRWFADESGAHMEVTDNGLGIAPEHIPRLTERFYRVDKGRSSEKGGTGLGLSIVKHVLSRHDGQLTIKSIPGAGSTFRCDFPADYILQKDEGIERSLTA